MLRIFVILLVFIVLCLFGIISVGLSTCHDLPKTITEDSKENQLKKESCSTSYVVIKIGIREVGRFIHEQHDEIIAVGTVVIAFFTVILGLFTVSLAKATDSLVGDARLTSERELRPYISVTPKLVFNWASAESTIVGVSVDLENHGQTIGTEIAYDFSMRISPVALLNDADFTKTERRYNQNNSLFPRAVLPVRLPYDRILTPDEIKMVEAGTHRFQTWGNLQYRDTFGKLRTTKMSFSFGGSDFAAATQGVPGATWTWEHCEQHNNAT